MIFVQVDENRWREVSGVRALETSLADPTVRMREASSEAELRETLSSEEGYPPGLTTWGLSCGNDISRFDNTVQLIKGYPIDIALVYAQENKTTVRLTDESQAELGPSYNIHDGFGRCTQIYDSKPGFIFKYQQVTYDPKTYKKLVKAIGNSKPGQYISMRSSNSKKISNLSKILYQIYDAMWKSYEKKCPGIRRLITYPYEGPNKSGAFYTLQQLVHVQEVLSFHRPSFKPQLRDLISEAGLKSLKRSLMHTHGDHRSMPDEIQKYLQFLCWGQKLSVPAKFFEDLKAAVNHNKTQMEIHEQQNLANSV